jgi:hypothetical protein
VGPDCECCCTVIEHLQEPEMFYLVALAQIGVTNYLTISVTATNWFNYLIKCQAYDYYEWPGRI